jgi:FG-GAP-like repeat
VNRLRATLLGLACGATLTVVRVHTQTPPTFAAYYTEIPSTVIDAGYAPLSMFSPVTADLNGDGYQDLVVLGADYPGSGVVNVPQPGRVFLGDGDGHFAAATGVFPVDTLMTVNPRKVLFADFNRDGRADMFISCHGWDADPFPGEQNRLYLSRLEGGWRDATSELPQLSDFSHTSAVGDLSGRDLIDVFVGNGSGIRPYTLLNNGIGQFTQTSLNIPVGSNQLLDSNTGHIIVGATLADLNEDGLAELVVTGKTTSKIRNATILWNRAGAFAETDTTQLPEPQVFTNTHIDHDVQRIDVNHDGLQDLVIVGTQTYLFHSGWFVQILINRGNREFVDETADRVPQGESSGGTENVSTTAPVANWVRVLDFNQDGAPDFALEFDRSVAQGQPLVWINDGNGHFSTIKVGDLVLPGREYMLLGAHVMATRYGYSFITTQLFQGSGGLRVTGLLASKRKLPGVGR